MGNRPGREQRNERETGKSGSERDRQKDDKRDPRRDRIKGAFEEVQGHRTDEVRPEREGQVR